MTISVKPPHRVLLLVLVCSMLSGCPRFAYVELTNGTLGDVKIVNSGMATCVPAGGARTFRLGARAMEIQTEKETWAYAFALPYDGNDGYYFDGTLRMRLSEDGTLVALKVPNLRPSKVAQEPPRGFPLVPGKINSDLQGVGSGGTGIQPENDCPAVGESL